DELLSNEDVLMEDFKVYSNAFFDDEEINFDKVDSHYFNVESNLTKTLSNRETLFESSLMFDYLEEFSRELMPTSIFDEERIRREHEEYISFMEKLFSINSFPRPLENFHANTIVETLPSSPTPVEDKGDIHFLEELLVDDSILFPENESSNFDHQDDLSFLRPISEPPDVEFYFDLEPNSGEVISTVKNNIDELNEDECFDPREINVFANVEDDDYFPFIFVIQNFLPYLIYPEVFPLLLSAESEDTIFDPGISYQSSPSSVTQQLPQRSNEGIKLEIAKLIKNNRILLKDKNFPHEEAGMEVLLAKERILKLIQAWDDKQIESWSLPALLLQLLNDSRTIDEMLKQREKEANLTVQQEQEEQADDEEVLQDREKFMIDTQTFLEKFNHYSFGVMPRVLSIAWEIIFKIKEELVEYINSSSWNRPTFFFEDDEEYSIQYKEYLEKSPDEITIVLPTKEPEYSLSMGYEHLSTTPETASNEVTESSAKNLLPISSEYEVTSDDESGCDVPIKDESSSVFTTFSNPIFDDNDDFTSSDDESLSDEEILIEDFKVYSNPLFDDDEINSDEIDPHCFNAKSDLVESLSNQDILIDSSLKFDYLEEFSGALMPTNIVNEERIRREHEEYISFMEKLFSINSFPRPLENFHANTIVETLPSSESSNFDHQDDLSFSRPISEPPDVEFYFDLEPNSGEVISTVKNNIDELNEDECFDPGEINVFANVEDDDYFPFIFVIQIFLPYLIYPEVFPLLLSAESEDTIFDPGISV
nr:hypothetical protein [Tanacetum cinerariifolium]